ncbi:MAG: DTW domain-containing protein, partial [Gammaproteobacteria bacterium]|nr:DTW domain-containing protein [Gammaproteobacteria bacterium]
ELDKHISNLDGAIVLYPSDDAQLLTPEFVRTLPRPMTLVVPDGNWRQTYKMRRRDPTMAALRPVKLVPGAPSQYRVRRETKTGGLATIEAIARALGLLEGPEVQVALETLMDIMVSRTMSSRGK